MLKTHRIAFVSSLPFGGQTTFLCNLAGELARRGNQTIVVSPENVNAFASDFAKAGVKVVLQGPRRMIFEDRLRAMLQALAAFQATVVIACIGADSYETLRYLPKGVYRMAVIQSDHAIFYDAVGSYAGCLDAVVGVSTRIAGRLAAREVFRNISKLCLLHGVSVPPTVESRGSTGPPLRVLYLGRLGRDAKRVHLFPEMLRQLRDSGVPFHWTIAGDGEERGFLEANLKSAPPHQTVSFTGPVRYAGIPALLRQQDIFLLVSDYEGLPLSLLEAMGHGLVPVVSDLASGIRDVVDAGNGMLVPVNDVEGYARAIIHLHNHRDELAAKSAAAHERVKKEFSVEAMADRWLAAFPPNPPAVVAWPTHWDIKPLLVARHPVYYSPPLRVLRRLAMKFRR